MVIAAGRISTGRAIFLDRDGTLVLPKHYPSQPHELVLYEGIAPRLATLQAAGFRIIVVTNQSGLAFGFFNDTALERMNHHLAEELLARGVRVDAIYHCPHHPNGTIINLAITCACRKPEPGMLQRAADEWNVDLARSWMVGDILHDIEAGNRAGCRTVLVNNGGETEWIDGLYRRPEHMVSTTVEALDFIISTEELGIVPLQPCFDDEFVVVGAATAGAQQ